VTFSPAKTTFAAAPPMVIAGSGESVPDCDTAPAVTGVDVVPKPLA
jgi:hypothetical protein